MALTSADRDSAGREGTLSTHRCGPYSPYSIPFIGRAAECWYSYAVLICLSLPTLLTFYRLRAQNKWKSDVPYFEIQCKKEKDTSELKREHSELVRSPWTLKHVVGERIPRAAPRPMAAQGRGQGWGLAHCQSHTQFLLLYSIPEFPNIFCQMSPGLSRIKTCKWLNLDHCIGAINWPPAMSQVLSLSQLLHETETSIHIWIKFEFIINES